MLPIKWRDKKSDERKKCLCLNPVGGGAIRHILCKRTFITKQVNKDTKGQIRQRTQNADGCICGESSLPRWF